MFRSASNFLFVMHKMSFVGVFFSEEISLKMYMIRSRFSKSVLVFFSIEIKNQNF